jgi:hypothetical protein
MFAGSSLAQLAGIDLNGKIITRYNQAHTNTHTYIYKIIFCCFWEGSFQIVPNSQLKSGFGWITCGLNDTFGLERFGYGFTR